MKNRIAIIVFILSLFVVRNSYAIIDGLAFLQTGMQKYTEYSKTIQDKIKAGLDAARRAKRGFDMAKSCFSDPLKCDIIGLDNIVDNLLSLAGSQKKGIATLPGSKLGDENVGVEDLSENLKAYSYKIGADDSLRVREEHDQKANAVIANDVSLLFAKAMVVHQKILNEEGSSKYPYENLGDDISNIVAAQNNVLLDSQRRIANIVELKSYMITGLETSNLKSRVIEDSSMMEE